MPFRLVGLASFPSPNRGTGYVLILAACRTVQIHHSSRVRASASPTVRSRVTREKVAFNGMIQEQQGQVSILVLTSGCSKVGKPDRARSPGRRRRRGKQRQTKEKKFFCDGFKSSTRSWFLTPGFPVGLALPPLSALRLSSTFYVPSTKNASLYHTAFGRNFCYNLLCQCPYQYRLPCIEGPRCFQGPGPILRSVNLGHGSSGLSLIWLPFSRWIQ